MADDDEKEIEHPALKNFNAPVEYVRHTLKSAFKGGLKGALIGAAVAVGFALLSSTVVGGMIGAGLAGMLAIFPPLAPLAAIVAPAAVATGGAIGFGSTGILAALANGAMWGGGIGAAVGAGFGVSNAEEAVEERKEQTIAVYDKKAAYALKLEALKQRQEMTRLKLAAQAQEMNLAPTQGLPAMEPKEHGIG